MKSYSPSMGKTPQFTEARGSSAHCASYKLAEAAVIEEIIDQPVPDADDDEMMSELDGRRRDALVTAMEGGSQTFITTANIDYFNETMLNKSNVIHLPLV